LPPLSRSSSSRARRHVVADQRGGVGRSERAELDPLQHALALGERHRRRDQAVVLHRAMGERKQHAAGRRAAQDRREQLDRRRIGPVHVVEHQPERLLEREPFEQLDHGPVRAVALGGERGAGLRERRERREDRRQLANVGGVESPQPARIELGEVIVERVDEHRVGQVALELLGAAREHQHDALRGARRELREHPRLADPRLARELEHAHVPGLDLAQQRLQPCLLPGPAYERRRREPCRHALMLTRGGDAGRS